MERKQERGNPWETANLLSRTFFWWVLPIFKKGYQKDLDEDDLYDCCLEDNSEFLGDSLQRQWKKEQKKGKCPSLLKTAIHTFGGSYMFYASLALLKECLLIPMQSVMLGWLVHFYSENSGQYLTQSYLCGAGICVIAFSFILTHHPFFFGIQRVGMKLRVACCTLIYRKALKLSRASMGQTTVGQMVNLLSNDVNRFDHCFQFLPYFLVGPLQTVVTVAILWKHVNVACLAGLVILLLYIPIQFGMSKCFSQLRLKTAILTDERVNLMNEIIAGMRVIKMYTWEKPFSKLVAIARQKEVAKIKLNALLRSVNIVLSFVSSKVILFACFITFVLMGGQLTAERVFVSMALFHNLLCSMTVFLPSAIARWAEGKISMKRIEARTYHHDLLKAHSSS